LEWISSSGVFSYGGILTSNSGKKYFLKYSNTNGDSVVEREWEIANKLRLFVLF
jgi:hypothetical protein